MSGMAPSVPDRAILPDTQKATTGGLREKQNEFDPPLPEIRSPEYREVIGAPPPIAVRSGIAIAGILLLVLAAIAFLLPYSAVLSAPVQLVSSTYPKIVVAQADGRLIQFGVQDGAVVQQNQVLGVIDGDGDAPAKLRLQNWLKKIPVIIGSGTKLPPLPPEDPAKLGNAGAAFVAAAQAVADLDAFNEISAMAAQLNNLRASAGIYAKMQPLLARKKLGADDAVAASQRLAQDRKILVANGFAAPAYADQFVAQSQTQNDLAVDARLAVANAKLSQLGAASAIDALTAAQAQNQRDAADRASAAIEDLRKAIFDWASTHVLSAPGDGHLRLFGFWTQNQLIHAGDEFATIDPADQSVTGFAFVPAAGFGRISPGQHASVYLDAFPQAEFGLLQGRVSAISEISEAGRYRVLLAFPNGLRTTRHINLAFTQNMTGVADITVERMNLLQHLLYGLATLSEHHS